MISIYATVYNNAYVVEDSVRSLIRALPDFDDRFELVIVDNYSTDGTWERLLKLRREHRNIRLASLRCTRGRGRDVALRLTEGDYVMYVDLDEIFDREFGLVVDKLSRVCVDGELWSFHGFSTRRTMVEVVGGWRDLNHGEDFEVYARAARRGARIRSLCVKTLRRNIVLSESGRHRERRYARNVISYITRLLRDVRDQVVSNGLYPSHVTHMMRWHYASALKKVALLAMSAPLSLIGSALSELHPLHESVRRLYLSTSYVLPEDLGLPRRYMIARFSHAHYAHDLALDHLRALLRRDPEVKVLTLWHGEIVCYRDLNVLIDELSRAISTCMPLRRLREILRLVSSRLRAS